MILILLHTDRCVSALLSLAALLFARLCHAQSPGLVGYDFGQPALLPRAQLDTWTPIITGTLGRVGAQGMNGSDGPSPPRKDIRRLKNDPFAWNLYLLGLSMMQWQNQSDAESWYQIAGVCPGSAVIRPSSLPRLC